MKCAAMLVLPVPAVPETSRLPPRKPGPSMRNGYSSGPCAEPRYLETCRRRVAIWSVTRASRLYSRVSMTSAGSIVTWSMTGFLPAISTGRSKPSEATFWVRSSSRSSKHMETPGSPYSWMPRTRNSLPNSAFPLSEPPHTSVGRPRGRPPPVIVSRPATPLGHFASLGVGAATVFARRLMGTSVRHVDALVVLLRKWSLMQINWAAAASIVLTTDLTNRIEAPRIAGDAPAGIKEMRAVRVSSSWPGLSRPSEAAPCRDRSPGQTRP